MSMMVFIVKGLMLVALSLAAFAVLAVAVGYEPAQPLERVTGCAVAPVPNCVLTLF